MRFDGRRAGVAGVLLLAFGAGALPGSDIPSVIGLGDAVALAIERNPTLQVAINNIAVRDADVVDRRQRLNPLFTFNVEDYPYFRSIGGPFLQQSEITARLDYEVEARGRRGLRTEAARQAAGIQRTLYEDRLRRLRLAVQRAFYQVVLAKSNLDVAQSILKQTDEVITLNKVRLDQGEIAELDLRRLEVEQLRFVDDTFSAQLDLRDAKSELLSLMGAPDLAQELDAQRRYIDTVRIYNRALHERRLSLYALANVLGVGGEK